MQLLLVKDVHPLNWRPRRGTDSLATTTRSILTITKVDCEVLLVAVAVIQSVFNSIVGGGEGGDGGSASTSAIEALKEKVARNCS